jgi:hypothetical protein
LIGFDNLKKEIFSSIIGSEVSNQTWTQACFGLEDGGLGYHDIFRAGVCAYICGIFQNYESLTRLDPSIFTSNIPMIKAFNESCGMASLLKFGIVDAPELSWTLESLAAIQAAPLSGQALSREHGTLQNKLYDSTRSLARQNLIDSFSSSNQVAWYVSNVDDDAKHSAYLAVLPKGPYSDFTNEQYILLLRRRLYLEMHLNIPGITKCCEDPKHKICDPFGTQMTSCKKNGHKIMIHDNFNVELRSLLSVSGINTTLEEKGVYQTAAPDCNMRPDLICRNMPQSTNGGRVSLPFEADAPDGRISQLVTDTSIVHPLPGPNAVIQLSLENALKPGRAAKLAFSGKISKHGDICHQNGLKFLPIIIETSGKMHPKTSIFYNIVLNTLTSGANLAVASITKFYWASRLSCCLQKSIANALLGKYKTSNGKSVRGLHFSHTHRNNGIENDIVRLSGHSFSFGQVLAAVV